MYTQTGNCTWKSKDGKTTIGDGIDRSFVLNDDLEIVTFKANRVLMHSLTKNGVKGLNDMLKAAGFNLMMPYNRFEYTDDREGTIYVFQQGREW